ncbi:YbfB/YjiJ family MFS transporter [Microlunatus aurantiacus]|uniref:YbfB/YjiJ family MFS transporter n=1 Tax=Microlunatus aurantiacus TaxID=446786 RepID=A0ABP7EJX3_9ACTN
MTSSRGLWSGLVLAGVGLIATCYGLARFAYGLFAPRIADEFRLTAATTGLIGSGGYVGYCLAIGLSTVATARWGPRRVAVAAGVVATVGISVVAAAPTALVLAAGVLIAGSSTGIVSPPLAEAVARWVTEDSRDTAQTVVNAGTGIGVLVSGPVALVLLDQWRLAWVMFAAVAAAMTIVIARAVPGGGPSAERVAGERPVDHGRSVDHGRPAGLVRLLAASAALGLASIAVWTFSQQHVETENPVRWAAPVIWTIIGAAGVVGAFSGPLVARVGVRTSWSGLMILLAVGIAGLGAGAGIVAVAVLAGAVFGASYIALSGVVLVWATRLYPTRASLGVGLAFFMIAAGQAAGAPLVGLLADRTGIAFTFSVCAVLALAGSLLSLGASVGARPSAGSGHPDGR